MSKQKTFNAQCRLCPRLSTHLQEIKGRYPDYHAAPVAPFGAGDSGLLIVGLAPGLHGANATGRPFTGDFAGILLYRTLYDYGFSNQPEASHLDDGLILRQCTITNAVKCLPPQNKPMGEEITQCNNYLRAELAALPDNAVVLALGGVAHRAVVRALGGRQVDHPFGHGNQHTVGQRRLLDSYHCSRYNTQTHRLTEAMFRAIFKQLRRMVDAC